jgi:branched-chain amino acid transport system substrate-binding protein
LRGVRLPGLVLAALLGLTGTAAAQELTVYSSLPLSGAARPQAEAVVRGAQLALADAGGAAGGRRVRYVSLNSATSRAGAWTPVRVARNAVRAARDRSAIAYIGEFNSGASAISLPILNEVGMPQVSPSNTAIGLTRGGPGAVRGEPEKYNPTGLRTYFRIAPNDRVQAAALATAMVDGGCRRIASLHDGELYGRGVATWVRRNARRLGARVVVALRTRGGRLGRVRRARPDCVAYSGITANGAVGVFRRLGRRLPRARFFATDGVAESGFTGRVPRGVAGRTLISVSTLAPPAYPLAGQAVLARLGNPDPYALYGYEAMRLVLDAVAAVGPRHRAIVRHLWAMPARPGVIGTYAFDRFGDTTLRTYGLYGITGRALRFAASVTAR